jgi:hypothetical protein
MPEGRNAWSSVFGLALLVEGAFAFGSIFRGAGRFVGGGSIGICSDASVSTDVSVVASLSSSARGSVAEGAASASVGSASPAEGLSGLASSSE